MVDGSEGRLRAQTIILQAYRRGITVREPLHVDTFMAAINRPNSRDCFRRGLQARQIMYWG